MILSNRLVAIGEFLPNCRCLADIGTDHGYIPIYAIQNKKCQKAIASDINKGPVKKATDNIIQSGYSDFIETRLGPGLSVIDENECDIILIAGMGGNLISDIINNDIEKAKAADLLILQPVQYPEVLRKYLLFNGFTIIDETMVNDGNKFYHIIKTKAGYSIPYEKEVYYYTGKIMIEDKNKVLYNYVTYKIKRLSAILNEIENSESNSKRNDVITLKSEFEEVLACLEK